MAEVHAGAAADLEHRTAAPAAEIDEAQQMVKLLEMILIEVVEKPARADRVLRDLEIVDVLLPVFAHLVDRRHRQTIIYNQECTVTSTSSGYRGFYSSLGATPPGITFTGDSLH